MLLSARSTGLVCRARLARPKPKILPDGSVKLPATTKADQLHPAEKNAMLAALPPLEQEDGNAATILTIRDSMCKWPIGDPADPNFAFCGRKSVDGPYCAEHAAVAFQPPKKRERRKSTYNYVRKIAG